MVNIEDYTPKDSDFTSYKPKGKKVENSLKEIREEEQEEYSLDKTIQHLEESIKEKENVMAELWKNIKMKKEEPNFLRNKRDEQSHREMFGHDTEIETSESRQINFFEDRLVIYVDIKVSGYLQYTLDA